jgi:signal recognition particle receptor subunit beta
LVYFNPASKEITAKIVYYGPGMCGKTTNLQKVHELMAPQMKSDLVSVATETDRTIYFDFLPLRLGKIAGFDFVVRTFTVPGQPYYAETRKMVLQGADGVVFVADSQRYMLDQNKDSLLDLKRNLKENGLDYQTIPLIF